MAKATVVDRVSRHRESLRAEGLRPVQIWVADTRRRGFAKECRRQSLILSGDPQEKKILKWLAGLAAAEGWK